MSFFRKPKSLCPLLTCCSLHQQSPPPSSPTLPPSLPPFHPSLCSFGCFTSAAGWFYCPYFLSHGSETGSLLSTIWSCLWSVSLAVAVETCFEVEGLFITWANKSLLRRPGQSLSQRESERVRLFTPPVCASVRQTALHLRLTPLSKHTMDSWTVAASFLLIGFISSAALSHFDTGKENFSAPSFPPGMRSEVECAWWEASPKSTSSLLNHISWITQTHTNSALTYFGLFWTITVPWESLFMVHGLGSSLTTRDLFSLLPPNLHAASSLRVFGVRPKQKSQGRCCVSTIIEWVNEQRDWSDQILLLPPHAYCVNTYDPSSVSKDNRLAVLTKLML